MFFEIRDSHFYICPFWEFRNFEEATIPNSFCFAKQSGRSRSIWNHAKSQILFRQVNISHVFYCVRISGFSFFTFSISKNPPFEMLFLRNTLWEDDVRTHENSFFCSLPRGSQQSDSKIIKISKFQTCHFMFCNRYWYHISTIPQFQK